jgi:hypothetical protein
MVVLAAIACAGCGGGSNSSTSTEEPGVETGVTTEATGAAGSGGAAEAGGPSSNGKPHRSHFHGGEEDVEEFGSEAAGSEKEAVLSTEHKYLAAIAIGDYNTACRLISSNLDEEFGELVQGSGSGTSPKCKQFLPHVVASNAAQIARQQLSGKVVKVRVEADQSFIVFHAPGARLFVFPMHRESGGWKVGAISSTVLAPSAATLGE